MKNKFGRASAKLSVQKLSVWKFPISCYLYSCWCNYFSRVSVCVVSFRGLSVRGNSFQRGQLSSLRQKYREWCDVRHTMCDARHERVLSVTLVTTFVTPVTGITCTFFGLGLVFVICFLFIAFYTSFSSLFHFCFKMGT